MYREYFELAEMPFQLTPDAHFLYRSKSHARAKAYMDDAARNGDSLCAITGETGSGKTTLIQHLLASLHDDVVVAMVQLTQRDEVEFFRAVLIELGLQSCGVSKEELLDTLNTYLSEQRARGRQVILIVDEAQNLSTSVLEEIRSLTRLDTPNEKPLNAILVGQPELNKTLDSAHMEQLAQRIHVQPLTRHETGEYIDHRLKLAGVAPQTLFPASSIPAIHRYTGGIPRLINTLCDTALIATFVAGYKTVTDAILAAAIEELSWAPYGAHHRPQELRRADTPMPRLIRLHDGARAETYSLAKGCLRVGRLSSNDVMIEDSAVSAHHAKIITLHGHCFIEDLDSTNGTLVNSERIRSCVLKHGDIIELGRCRLQYRKDRAVSGARRLEPSALATVDSGNVHAAMAEQRGSDA